MFEHRFPRGHPGILTQVQDANNSV